MRRPYQILWPLFSLFLVRVDLTDLYSLKLPIQIVKVFDGDTVLVRHGTYEFRVRMDKIDTPEKTQPFYGGGDAGAYAKKCLLNLIGKESRFNLIFHQYDMYGRVLGEVGDLNFRAIKAGCTGLYPYARFSSKHEKFKYLRAMTIARREHLGIWNFSGFRQPKLWRKAKKRTSHRRSHPRGYSR